MSRKPYINPSPIIMTRNDAAKRGLARYYTGLPCKKGHLTERSTSSGGCLDCMNPMRQPNAARYPEQFIVVQVMLKNSVAIDNPLRVELRSRLEALANVILDKAWAEGQLTADGTDGRKP